MDVLDHLYERPGCGLCGRLIRYGDDFCTSCRHVTDGVPLEAPVVLEAELATVLAVAS